MEERSDRNQEMHIPEPPAAAEREELLPSERPKSAEDDPRVPERLEALLRSPNYRRADEDPDFLRQDAVRGVRLQVDYLKAELLLREYGIEHTIAVFGGTRIVEEAEARRRLTEAAAAAERDPEHAPLRRKREAARHLLEKSRYYDIAREFGAIVGRSGSGPGDCRLTLMTGGGPGVMEAANRGAYDVGAKSIGLNISLPHEQFPNPYISPELCFQFHYFSMRKLHFFNRAKALVAFPGGYGTMDEVIEALTLVQTRKIPPFPIVLVGQEFWERVIDFECLLEEGVIDPEDLQLFWFAESAREIWEGILLWHRENGTPMNVSE
jgi:uncharacterized protein (TIGR00730 family)